MLQVLQNSFNMNDCFTIKNQNELCIGKSLLTKDILHIDDQQKIVEIARSILAHDANTDANPRVDNTLTTIPRKTITIPVSLDEKRIFLPH